ncbi:MAG: Fe-Mn family superoxide dismutase [Actinomycetota bacterium]
MAHEVKDFSALLGTLQGISDEQLQAHFTLYQGYVKKINEIEEKLAGADRALANYSFGEYSELKRREAVPLMGTYLHQAYFENLSGAGGDPSDAVKKGIESAFGSFDSWQADLKAAAASTPGWVLLTRSAIDGRFHHYILFEHHLHYPVHQQPLLVLDCWEHAYFLDYKTNKGGYVDAFIANMNWAEVNARATGGGIKP